MARFLFPLTLLLLLGHAGNAPAAGSAPSQTTASEEAAPAAEARIKAVTLDAVERPPDATLRQIKALGATHLTLVSFAFQPAPGVPRLRTHTEGGWYSESDAGIRDLARRADSLGLGLIIKPHVWVGRDGKSRLDISFDEEADWQRWQKQYRRFILHYARLAEEVEAEVLVVGMELTKTSAAREGFWRGLIRDVRGVYAGKLTYAANWYEEYEAVPFWDALDFVGVQGYFPLSEEEEPTLKALREGWQQPLRALRRVSSEAGKPILFTEIGYRSAKGAAKNPWHWPEAGDAPYLALQARLYEAFFQEVWPQPWIAGAVLWKWHAPRGRDPRGDGRQRRREAGFTPQGKPAVEAIRRGFGADGTRP